MSFGKFHLQEVQMKSEEETKQYNKETTIRLHDALEKSEKKKTKR